MNILELNVNEENSDERLDSYLSDELENVSRSYIQSLIKKGHIEVNNIKKKASYIVKHGDSITVNLPEPEKLEIKAENIQLNFIYEDDSLLIVNKPQGMVVHPAPGNYTGTLVNALLYHIDKLSSINGVIRPGIVHRLDKDTSGLLLIAKNDFTHRFLSEQLKDRNVHREYIALVHGIIKNNTGTINKPIGRNSKDRKKMAVVYSNSKEAITNYEVLQRFSKYTLLKVKLETGRTHQIRVHFSDMNHPVLGDPLYSNGKNEFNLDKQLLHARKLGFFHPIRKEYLEFECDIPDVFKDILTKLEKREMNEN